MTPNRAAHGREADDVLADLGVDPDRGLSSEEAGRRLRRSGSNTVGSREGAGALRILWQQLRSVVVGLLAVAAAVGFAIGETVEAVAVLVVLIVNTAVGFVTELRAARAMESLQTLLTVIAEVERDDRRDEIDAEGLVPGDIVGIEAGERIPADLRLFETQDLSIDESALTGESDPTPKDPAPVEETAPVAERTCMAFMGTVVATGRGRGVVVSTGRDTELGGVVELTEDTTDRRAPLQEGLDALGRKLTVGVAGGAVLLVLLGVLRGQELQEVAEVAIAIAIAVVPEGLPAVATLTLAVGMRRMAASGALVRRLPAVETLGSTTVICSDKTGTLTENRMSVERSEVFGSEDHLWESAVLCNDADVDEDGDPVGDPTEVALIVAAEQGGLDWRRLRESTERVAEIPFEPSTKRMAVVVDGIVHAKGAPEVLIDPGSHPREAEIAEQLASEGLRVLAIGRGTAPGDLDDPDEVFASVEVAGVVGMEDPPRPSAVAAVEVAHRAGIRVVMITGDRPDTALAIANRLGLRSGRVVHGSDLGDGEGTRMETDVADVDVFARVSPHQKHSIVGMLQDRGEIVAVTGDGVNDAPALARADIGVAMGAGTDVAQEAADIVLTDDDFATIERAVAEGRRIYENIRRFGQFLFSWHVAEVALVVVALLAGIPTPITALAILWNNLIIDVLPSFALALEPGRQEVMQRPPRPPTEPVITSTMVRRILLHGALVGATGLIAHLLATSVLDLPLDQARTVTFLALSGAQTLAVFNARSETGSGFAGAARNRWLWLALAATAILEAGAVAIPALRDLLGLGAPTPKSVVVALALATVPLLIVQTFRAVRVRQRRG